MLRWSEVLKFASEHNPNYDPTNKHLHYSDVISYIRHKVSPDCNKEDIEGWGKSIERFFHDAHYEGHVNGAHEFGPDFGEWVSEEFWGHFVNMFKSELRRSRCDDDTGDKHVPPLGDDKGDRRRLDSHDGKEAGGDDAVVTTM
jgi:hypothetical protein